MNGKEVGEFRLLSDEEFKALTVQGRVEYLRRAVAIRNRLNRQLDATLKRQFKTIAKGRTDG